MPVRAVRVPPPSPPIPSRTRFSRPSLRMLSAILLVLAVNLAAAPRFALAQGSVAADSVRGAIAGSVAGLVPDTSAVFAPPPAATSIRAHDAPNDKGNAIEVVWTADSTAAFEERTGWLLERGPQPDGPWTRVDSLAAATMKKTDSTKPGETWYYRVIGLGPGGASAPTTTGSPVTAAAQWFHSGRWSVFLAIVLFFAAMLFFIAQAQSGAQLFVRRIPGIDAIEEAIGRATEMGRAVLYVPGINDIDDIQTMASLNILESVAKMTARYETPIVVPVNYPVVMTLAQEMVKNGYVAAGRADGYDPNSVRYVTTEQFAYVAALTGIMLRDKPAANIYLGSFYAESLLLAETGFQTKAIQIAGTAQVAQLPFFVVACDYTLIGEELYAASAYLSREPVLLGSIRGQDLFKALCLLTGIIGIVAMTMGATWFATLFQTK
jgi:uncharacterized protein DUF6754